MIENLKSATEILVTGWGGIFVVMIILYVAIKILLAFDKRDSQREEEKEQSESHKEV